MDQTDRFELSFHLSSEAVVYVVAPSEAEVTRSTYLRKTPAGQRSAGGVKSFRRCCDFFVADFDVELAIGNIEVDDVAFADRGDGSADEGFGSDVAGGEAARCAGEAAVGQQGNGVR